MGEQDSTATPHGLLAGKRVVVTGGAGLLGRCFCRGIVDQGGFVIVADRDFDSASLLSIELNNTKEKCATAFALDITDAESVSGLISFVEDRFGGADALVNNAYPRNANYGRPVEEVTYKDFCENLSLHLGGYFLMMQQFSLFFRRRGSGCIVNMGSIYGTLPPRFSVYEGTSMTMPPEYAAIKAGVHQLTLYFAQCFKKYGVRVNTLSPGGIADEQPESFLQAYNSFCGTKGMLEPDDIVGTLLFLLSDASRYVTGRNLIVDDGFSL
ncbi:MAG: SDR family oxidoreductase [Synergistaceae bacterium]|nr:SDR family oxidoreductase [Synergistaceae bacterium]